MKIYTREQLIEQNFFQKLFHRLPKENALIEINSLLADSQAAIETINLETITAIADKYKVNLVKEFKESRFDLFNRYVRHCLTDQKLDEKEISILRHLKDLLLLDENDTKRLISVETDRLYQDQVNEAISDGKLEAYELENLERLKNDLLLPDKIASKIYEKSAEERLKQVLEDVLSDERISPDEELELIQLTKNLGIEFDLAKASKGNLEKYKLYWQLENGELPEISSDINLQRNESLHFTTDVNWYEHRKVTKRVNYGGPVARIKIAKGLYYRIGSVDIRPVSQDVLQMIDSGKIYLTSKRVIFMGSRGNKTININKILDFSPFKNGVDLQKDSGKSPFLEFEENIDIFTLILLRLMREN